MSLIIGDNLVVSLHYTLTDGEGETIDSSIDDEPMAYLHGAGNIIPGLENALVGKAVGDKFAVTVEPADGYGDIEPELEQTIDRAAFQGVDVIEVGMNFEAQGDQGEVRSILVTAVDGDNITIDANHPLAGVTLNFDVEVVAIREATEDELEHGHAH